jgi:hypothetical protein
MALIVFIMAILAEAFEKGIGTFRRLKAVSDMNERLRSASSLIRRYLAADHFEGKKRLSDPTFWNNGPPREGFFRIVQQDPDTTVYEGDEGPDSDLNHSYLSTKNVLHLAVKLRGNSRGDFFQTSLLPANSPILLIPHGDARYQDTGTVYGSSWAEVAFFLRDSGDTTNDPQRPTQPRLKLYTLYMRQRLVVPNSDTFAPTSNPDRSVSFAAYHSGGGNYAEMSFGIHSNEPSHLYFNSPQDLTMPHRRLGALQAPGGTPGVPRVAGATSATDYPILADEPLGITAGSGTLAGNDVLLADVLSMDVRVLVDDTGVFKTLKEAGYPTGTSQLNNLLRPLPTVAVFDTWSSGQDRFYSYSDWASQVTTSLSPTRIPFYKDSSGNPLRIRAIQITLRVWDRRTQQTRQTSIIQDM